MSLWKVKVPSKIRIFLWRLAKHSLPIGAVLHHRKMAQCSVCFFCGMEDSWRHSLLECTMVRCIWTLEKKETVELLSEILENDAKPWLDIMTEILPQEDVIRVAVTLWAIWYARRKAIHENVYQSPLSTHNFVDKLVSELGEEAHVQRPQARVRERRTASIVPSSGFIKINVNATLSKNVSMASTATIVRDEDGCFMGASALVLRGIVDPEVMESTYVEKG